VTITYKAGNAASSCTLTATEAGTAKTGSVIITQTLSVASAVTVSANPTTNPADGTSSSAITATVTNAAGGPVVGDTVNFTGSAVCGAFTPASAVTNGSGVATSSVKTSTTVGTCTITATELTAGKSGTATVTQTVVKNAIALAPASANLAADGAATQSLTATVTNNGAGVVGDTVNYTKSPSVTGSCGTLSAVTGTTAAGGVAPAITYTASLVVGFCSVTATETGNGSTSTSVIQQHGSSVGTAVSETATPATLPADGKSTSVVTATVTGAGAANDPLSFAVSPATCGTLSSNFATTNPSGTATVTYTASLNAPLTCAIGVTEANGSTTGSVNIAQTVVNNIITASANPAAIKGDGISTSVVTAHVTSGVDGSNVSGDAMTFTIAPGAPGANCNATGLSAASAKTDANGMATVTYTSKVAPNTFCAIVAKETVTLQSATATITQTA
jgi:adhesin/invasin